MSPGARCRWYGAARLESGAAHSRAASGVGSPEGDARGDGEASGVPESELRYVVRLGAIPMIMFSEAYHGEQCCNRSSHIQLWQWPQNPRLFEHLLRPLEPRLGGRLLVRIASRFRKNDGGLLERIRLGSTVGPAGSRRFVGPQRGLVPAERPPGAETVPTASIAAPAGAPDASQSAQIAQTPDLAQKAIPRPAPSLFDLDGCPGRTCSSESSESRPYDVNAVTRCGCWLPSPSRLWRSAFSSTWASRPGRHLITPALASGPVAGPGSNSRPQISIRRRPTVGTLAPDLPDERVAQSTSSSHLQVRPQKESCTRDLAPWR